MPRVKCLLRVKVSTKTPIALAHRQRGGEQGDLDHANARSAADSKPFAKDQP